MFWIIFVFLLWHFADCTYADNNEQIKKLVEEALKQTHKAVIYDSAYRIIPYPNGDVSLNYGVCSDVVIRAYRSAFNTDLQVLVHEDMKKNFKLYPNLWGIKKPDTNIDHRRVPNLNVFFKRFAKILPCSYIPKDYSPGDIVIWDIGNFKKSIPHIGIVSNKKSFNKERYKVVHNIGEGPKCEDVLFSYQITGHYTFSPEN
ncbi:MAG: DUF1287 domain-containing protein [Alphaproteobacteria bacterium]